MGGLGTLGMVSGESYWAGISEMVRQSSEGALGAELFASKVEYNFVKV